MSVALMLAGLIWFRYYGNFSSFVIPAYTSDFLMTFFPFCFAFLLQAFFLGSQSFLSNPKFWILLLLGPVIFTFKNYLALPDEITRRISNLEQGSFFMASAKYCWRSLLLLIPVYMVWMSRHKKQMNFYGWKFNFNPRFFWPLFLCMLPLIFFAAMQPDFATVYPKAITSAGLHANSNTWQWLLFELSYGLDFLSIEVFFRGFLILAFVRYAGVMAIVPAACFYCCIHFDKPMAEAISSFFGGLLLGCISYHTRSIWTGFFLHLSMAWLMELVSFYRQL